MSELLHRQNISVQQHNDVVVLNLARVAVPMHYIVGFKIAQGIRLAAKKALQANGEVLAEWRDMAELDESSQITNHSDSNLRAIKFNWFVMFKDEQIRIELGDQVLTMHYRDALQLAEWLRLCGAQAKSWVGDTSKLMLVSGELTAVNAE